jgi:ubiquinol-cytochrome c reductase iron-sulfur subunit
MSGRAGEPHEPGAELVRVEDLERMSVPERMLIGAEVDGVHIHRRERFPIPGTKAERRAERAVAACFLLTFVATVAFTVIYIVVPWKYTVENKDYAWFTPLLGITMGLALAGVGVGAVLWAKLLMPEEEVIQERHDGFSPPVDRLTTAAALVDGIQVTGLGRRTLLTRSFGLCALALGGLAVVPLGGLIKKPRNDLVTTPWRAGARLINIDRRPLRPADLEPGAIATVFPGVPGGVTAPDAPVLLIRLMPGQTVKARPGQENFGWHDYVAYSKICTHAGCPASLYEKQTGRLLCPCHQSQFDLLQDAKPVFGPAARSLPKLAITVDEEGYFVARGDFAEPIGPSFWERA